MTPLECFRINSPNVIREIIDCEAVLVRLDTGSYYSIDKAEHERISTILAARHAHSPGSAEPATVAADPTASVTGGGVVPEPGG